MPNCRMPMILLLALIALVGNANALSANSLEIESNEYLVAGKVVWAHAGASSIAIRGSSLLGHLRVRVRVYRVKQPSSLVDLRSGDAVTAVFSRRDGMLHRLRRARRSAK
jgi:hypothetical protein